MEQLLTFFENIPSSYRTALLLGGVVLFWVLEGVLPLHRLKYNKYRHAGTNLFLTLTTAIVGFTMAWVLLQVSQFVSANEIGLLYLIELPLWAQVLLGVVLLDLIGAYFIHWTEHKVQWMWQFHVVHHSDTTVDVTTGLRHHPGETVFRIVFTIMAVFIVGAPMGIVMLYQSLSVLFAHLTHANISMPEKLDKAISYVFVSPNMHKVHHHYQQPLTDTNYGNIFSIWDRLFGTYAYADPKKLIYGVDTYTKASEHSHLGSLLMIPFKGYRKTPEAAPAPETTAAERASVTEGAQLA